MEIPPFGLSMYQKGGTTLLDYGWQKAVNLVGLLLRMRLFVPPARIPALANTGFVDVPIAVAGLHKAPLKRMELGSCNGAAGIIGHQAGRQAAAYRVLPVGLMFLEQKKVFAEADSCLLLAFAAKQLAATLDSSGMVQHRRFLLDKESSDIVPN